MKTLIRDALKRSNADFIEIRLEDIDKTEVTFSGADLKKAQSTRDFGGYVRALVNGAWGFVSFTDPDKINDYVRDAEAKARDAGGGDIRLADTEAAQDTVSAGVDSRHDPRSVSLEEKVAFFRKLSDRVLTYSDKIISSGVGYREEFRRIYFGTSQGTLLEMEGLWGAGGLSAIAREGNVVQSVYSSFGTRNSWLDILEAENAVEEVCSNVLELVKAEPVKGGKYTVILDPRLSGVFIHEAFGHLSEADNVSANPKLLNQMKIGTRFGRDFFNVLDGGTIPGQRGSFAYDDEGTPASLTYLIKDGLLAGRLHSRETAAAMNEKPTGNARTISYRFAPICRMSNTFIDAGPHTFENMLSDVKEGLYVIGGGSGNTSKGLFTFSAEKARLIKNGKLGPLVRDLVLTGNVFQTLMNIDQVGDDLTRSRAGGCGKSVGARMQYPLNVSMGSPHIRIRDVLIGGR